MTDFDVFAFFRTKYAQAEIARAFIVERDGQKVVEVHTGRPGLLIGNQGAGLAKIKAELETSLGPIHLHIAEVRDRELEPRLVADNVALNLSRGVALESAIQKPIDMVKRFPEASARVVVAGALGDHERRSEAYNTANAEYGSAQAMVNGQKVTVDVWIAKADRQTS